MIMLTLVSRWWEIKWIYSSIIMVPAETHSYTIAWSGLLLFSHQPSKEVHQEIPTKHHQQTCRELTGTRRPGSSTMRAREVTIINWISQRCLDASQMSSAAQPSAKWQDLTCHSRCWNLRTRQSRPYSATKISPVLEMKRVWTKANRQSSIWLL